jgi:hypothetical protein
MCQETAALDLREPVLLCNLTQLSGGRLAGGKVAPPAGRGLHIQSIFKRDRMCTSAGSLIYNFSIAWLPAIPRFCLTVLEISFMLPSLWTIENCFTTPHLFLIIFQRIRQTDSTGFMQEFTKLDTAKEGARHGQYIRTKGHALVGLANIHLVGETNLLLAASNQPYRGVL